MAVYESPTHVVIAHRGTDLNSDRKWGDLFTDGLIGVGVANQSKRYQADLSAAEKIHSTVGSHKKIIHTGHSLGGYMANKVARKLDNGSRNVHSMVFNPGSSPATLSELFSKKSILDRITDKSKGRHVILRNEEDWIAAGSMLGFHAKDEVYKFKSKMHWDKHTVNQFL